MAIQVLQQRIVGVGSTDDLESGANLRVSGVGNTWVSSVDYGLTASGTTQTDAYILSAVVSVFTTVAGGSGCVLTTSSAIGREYEIYNMGSYPLSIYPASGQKFIVSAANAAYAIASGTGAIVRGVGSSNWLARRFTL